MTITSEVEAITQPNHGISHGDVTSKTGVRKKPVLNSLRSIAAVRSLRHMWRESFCVFLGARILVAIF